MRISTLFTVASLFLIGSFSLPQPENLEATQTIEDREAKIPFGIPGGPIPIHSKGADWPHHHKESGGAEPSNSTKIKEREAHHEYEFNPLVGKILAVKLTPDSPFPGAPAPIPGKGPEWEDGHNSTKIKERQGAPPEGHFEPPEGMSWMEFKKHMKHMKEEGGSGGNSTKVRMMKFRD